MRQYVCSECGYRKMERDFTDVVAEVPFYSGFGGGFMNPIASEMSWQEDTVCPNCGKASSWHPET